MAIHVGKGIYAGREREDNMLKLEWAVKVNDEIWNQKHTISHDTRNQ